MSTRQLLQVLRSVAEEADGLDAFLEYRRDWSNRPYFITSNPASPANHQDTAALGLVWWYGGKQGAW